MALWKRIVIIIALVAGLFLLIFGTNWLSTLAYAQPSVCQAEINDNGHLLRKDEIPGILAAAQEVEALGADVHVWTFGELPNPDANQGDKVKDELTVWFNQQVAKCAEWRRSNSTEARGNLIVLAYSNNPVRSLMVIGEMWPRTDKQTEADRKTMSPAFKDGAFGRGFVTGLHTVRDIIKPSGQGQQPATPAQPSEPFDWSWLWYVLYSAIGLVVIVVAFVFIRRGIKTARQRREESAEAETGTEDLKSNLWTLEQLRTELEALVAGLQGYLEEDLRPIRERLAAFMHHYEEVVLELGEINGTVDDRDEAIRSRAASIILDAQQGNEAADRATQAGEQLRQEIDTLTALPTNLPERIEKVTRFIVACRRRVTAVGEEGLTTTSQEKLISDAGTNITLAKVALEGKRYGVTGSLLDKAEELAKQAATDAEKLRKTKARLVGQVAKIRTRRRPALQRRITTVTVTFTSLREEFAALHSDDLSDNCASAQTLHDGVEAILVRVEVGIVEQNWTEADQILAEAGTQLASGFTLLQAITNRYAELTELRTSAPQRATAALIAIRRVRTFIAENSGDITTDVSDTLRTAEGNITLARGELAQTQPNYNRVTTLLDSADSQTSSARTTVEREHEEAEAQRTRARQQREAAERALEDAAHYIRTHRSYVDDATVRRLTELEGRRTDDLSNAAFWVAVASAAQQVRSQAESDVDANTPDPPSYGSGSSGTTTSSGDLGSGPGFSLGSGDLGGSPGPSVSDGEL